LRTTGGWGRDEGQDGESRRQTDDYTPGHPSSWDKTAEETARLWADTAVARKRPPKRQRRRMVPPPLLS